MGRKPKVCNAKVVSLRLPADFVASLESEASNNGNDGIGDVLREKILSNGTTTIVKNAVSNEQKDALVYFVNFFFAMFKKGKLSKEDLKEYPDLIAKSKILQDMVK